MKVRGPKGVLDWAGFLGLCLVLDLGIAWILGALDWIGVVALFPLVTIGMYLATEYEYGWRDKGVGRRSDHRP